MRSHVVCPSVCLSVTLVDCDHIGWNSSEIISRLVSLGCSLSADPNIKGLLQGEHSEILAQSGPPPVDLSVGDIQSQIAAEWLQIAQRSTHIARIARSSLRQYSFLVRSSNAFRWQPWPTNRALVSKKQQFRVGFRLLTAMLTWTCILTVLYRRLRRDDATAGRIWSERWRAWQRTVDAATRCRHLRPCPPLSFSRRTVSSLLLLQSLHSANNSSYRNESALAILTFIAFAV